MPQTILLGGREFTALDMGARTVRWQLHVDRLIGESGIDRILPAQGEEENSYLLRLHAAVMRSGRACELLGCFLLPEGATEQDWTPAMATATATYLEGLATDADIAEVYSLGLEFVLGFFGRQLRSLTSSLSSSSAARRDPTSRPAAH